MHTLYKNSIARHFFWKKLFHSANFLQTYYCLFSKSFFQLVIWKILLILSHMIYQHDALLYMTFTYNSIVSIQKEGILSKNTSTFINRRATSILLQHIVTITIITGTVGPPIHQDIIIITTPTPFLMREGIALNKPILTSTGRSLKRIHLIQLMDVTSPSPIVLILSSNSNPSRSHPK